MQFRTVCSIFLRRILNNSTTYQKEGRSRISSINNISDKQSCILPGEERIRASRLLPDPTALLRNDDDLTIYEVFLRGLRISGNGPCLGVRNKSTGKYEWINYEEVLYRAKCVGSAFQELGLAPGNETLVGINCGNQPEFTLTYLATSCFGSVFVPIYSTLGAEGVNHIIKETEVELIICDAVKKVEYLVSQKSRFPCLRTLVLTEEPRKDLRDQIRAAGLQLLSFREFENLGKAAPKMLKPAKEDDIFTICWTSGTTGMPKGVITTHKNVIVGIKAVAEVWKPVMKKDPCMISYLPTGHIYETCIQAQFLYEGGKIGYYSGDIETLVDDIRALSPTYVPMVPRVLNRIYSKAMGDISKNILKRRLLKMALRYKEKHQLEKIVQSTDSIWHKYLFRSLRDDLGGRVNLITSTAATLSSDVALFFQVALGCPLLVTYGQTELGPATFTLPCGKYEANVGPPVPSAHVKLVDVPDMGYWAKDNIGEICVRGPTVCKGYYKDSEVTRKTIDTEGWLHTGDIGRWLPNGTLSLVDRKKNLFKLSQGEFISPEKIESVYSQSPLVAQIFVTGASDKDFVVGIVIPKFEELLKWSRKNGSNDYTVENLYQQKEIRLYLIQHLRSFGHKCGLNSLEQIRNIHLKQHLLTVDNGFLTANLKLKRKLVENFFQREVMELYKEGPIC